jgi:hypothetical protein
MFVDSTLTGNGHRASGLEKIAVIGRQAHTADGRKYVYAKAGTVALAINANVAKNAQANITATLSADAEIGARELKVNALTFTGDLEDATIATPSGVYRISGISADKKTIVLAETLEAPLASAATATIVANPFAGVATGTAIAKTETAVAAGAYFWARLV